jgi:alpha-glucoside transport system substrate-binding protein
VSRLAGVLAVLLCCTAAGCVASGRPRVDPPNAIEIFGPYRGVEADRFAGTLKRFVDATGIQVRYVGSVDFVDDLRRRVDRSADPPDVAVVPQPGLVRELADDDSIVPLGPNARAGVADNYPPIAAGIGRIDGTPYAVPWRLTVKSLVWYRPLVFALNGWDVPRTFEELMRLTDRIEEQSDLAPWCFTIRAGTSTGWVATDWSEDLVLRTAGAGTYRGWVTGEVRFADAPIAAAFDLFRTLVLGPGRVAGGIDDVIGTPVDEAVEPLFASPPGCAMYKQADFAEAWMPPGTSIGPDGDVDWFVLPGPTAGNSPIELGGDQIVQFRRDSDVDQLMAYLAGPTAGITWARKGGFLSPKSSIPDSVYPEAHLIRLAGILSHAPTIVFDASDQMPPDIGSGLLWSSITEWVAGAIDYPTFAERIDAARAADASGSSG